MTESRLLCTSIIYVMLYANFGNKTIVLREWNDISSLLLKNLVIPLCFSLFFLPPPPSPFCPSSFHSSSSPFLPLFLLPSSGCYLLWSYYSVMKCSALANMGHKTNASSLRRFCYERTTHLKQLGQFKMNNFSSVGTIGSLYLIGLS